MGGVLHRRHYLLQWLATTTATATLTLLLLSYASALSFTQLPGNNEREIRSSVTAVLQRRHLRAVGPGSSPPTCRSKCGNCLPCKPVHVPVHPGFSLPLEYYPEAWRCKCGNKLFMP